MQVSVTCRHMESTESIRSYARDKLEQELTEFPRVQSVHIILDVEKYRHSAEVVVTASSHIQVEAREISDDMYASIDGAVDKAARQLRRHRDKVQDHKSRERLVEIEGDVPTE